MKKVIVLLNLLLLVFFISAFSEIKKNSNFIPEFTSEVANVPTEEESFLFDFNFPFTGKSYNGFKNAIAFKESRGRYDVINSLGYLGKYQFGKSTLHRLKIYDTNLFLNSPQMQEDAFLALCSLNKWILRKDIKRSVGKKINGVTITESGILAAAHLSGAGNVKKYLRSFGEDTFKDAYGSSLQYYIKTFSGYDTTFIKANKNPEVK